MSRDFAVWYPDRRLSNAQADALYAELCEERTDAVVAHPAIAAFYTELTSLHPEIDDVPEDKGDDHDDSPWSVAMDRSDAHVSMCCVGSKAVYVEALLRRLAKKHGLAFYDPQQARVVHPDQYLVFYHLQREKRDVDPDKAEAMSAADVYTQVFGRMSEDGDYFGLIDAADETLQLMYRPSSSRYWCEIPVAAEGGSYGKWLSVEQAGELLKTLPDHISPKSIPGLKFAPWKK